MDRCALCPGSRNPVHADGPTNCKVLAIGEAPGQNEDRVGRPFIGLAGMEYNDNYLMLAGLHRSEIRQTNTVLCRPNQNKKPDEKLAMSCAEFHLRDEIWQCGPEIVILLGATAVNTLAPGTDLEAQHGIPFKGEVMDWPCWIVPMYHPAAGLHQTSLMIPLLEYFERLKPWLETGEWQWAVDLFVGSTRDYRLARTKREVIHYFQDYPIDELIGGDTESHDKVDFSVQISTRVGTGLMVLMPDQEALDELSLSLMAAFGSFFNCTLVLHNAESDIDLFERLVGSTIQYIDTMAMAYQLQNLPQKLKALSYRLLGRKRQSWMQLVGGASRDKLTDWLWHARNIAMEEFTVSEPRISEKTGRAIKPRIVKSPLEGFFNRLITQVNKSQDSDSPYDPWKRLKEFEYSVQDLVHMSRLFERLGDYPRLGIANCALDIARDYGCSDSDDTLALATELRRLKREAETGWGVVEGDWDRQHEIIQP